MPILPLLLIFFCIQSIADYDRRDWPHWNDIDRYCLNTRAEILVRDSLQEVTFRSSKVCLVDKLPLMPLDDPKQKLETLGELARKRTLSTCLVRINNDYVKRFGWSMNNLKSWKDVVDNKLLVNVFLQPRYVA